jgi:hypothetical protein
VFEHAGARAVHEPDPRWLRLVGNAHASGSMSRARAAKVVQRVRRDVVRGDTPYVEANSLISGLVGPVLDAFDDAFVVQIVREPLSYVSSAIAWGQYRFAGRLLNVVPYRRLAAPQYRPWSPAARLHWMFQGQFERLCWTWTAQNAAMRTQGGSTSRFRSIRFEDLIDPARGPELLGELFDSIGLSSSSVEAVMQAAAASKNESASRSERVELSAPQRTRLREVCGAEAARYGYVV